MQKVDYDDKIKALFAQNSYELISTIPWKQLNIARISLFTEDRPEARQGRTQGILVNILFTPLEIMNITRFYLGKRPFLNFSTRPDFYMKRLEKRLPNSHALITLFFLCEPVPQEHFRALFGDSVITMLLQAKFISVADGSLIPKMRVHLFKNHLFVESTENRSILDASYKLAAAAQRSLPSLRQKKRLLDVGTGTGFHAILFADDFEQAAALDIDSDALENTALNCQINNKENVICVQSDMYANTEGQFDLIMANPPPLFVPDGYRDNSEYGLFYDGGDFGIELARRIMSGFDEYLSDHGIAVIGLISSVVDGKDLALDFIRSTFDETKYRIEATIVSDVIESEFSSFYRSRGISNRPRMIITFHKGQSGGLQVRKLGAVKSILFWCQRKLAQFIAGHQ
jgi:methylase of polypeptide subunit release factors